MNLQPIATIVASILVLSVTGYFAWHQKGIANNKLRLDLYDRRFEIFNSIFAFYNAMTSWKATPKQQEARDRFFKACQESGFLFTKESGIEAQLKTLYQAGVRVIAYKENPDMYKSDPASMINEHNIVNDIQLRIFEEGLTKLRVAMHPYLDFSKVL